MLLPMLGLLLVIPAAPVPPEKPADQPRGPAPEIRIAGIDEGGKAYLESQVMKAVSEVRTETVVVGGRAEARNYTVTVQIPVTLRQPLEAKGVKLFGVNGKKLDARDLPKLLANRAPALVSSDGKEVDPFYLKLAREGTVVVVLPVAAETVPVPPAPPRPPEVPPVKP